MGHPCVSEADLRAYALGELPEGVGRLIAEHLDDCPDCRETARRADDATDPVVNCVRRAFGRPAAAPAVIAAPAPGGPAPAPPGYEVLAELGRGGMGVVYLARQHRPDRLVALKMILAGAHAGAARTARLLSEADATARLQHPHIVAIHEVGESAGLPYLALEYVAGGSLADRLDGTPQPARAAAALVAAVARAVHHAHASGIVHRDLKPANVLLVQESEVRGVELETRPNPENRSATAGAVGSGDGFRLSEFSPKVSDFGLAKREGLDLTGTGELVGTPSYMAPEQAEGRKDVGPAADVWALGAILYELLAGRPPFRGATPLETLEQVRTQEPVPPERLRPDTPRDLGTVCLKCLAKDPRRRYATAADLAEDLHRFLTDRPPRARRSSRAEQAWRWCRRNPAVAALAAALAVLLPAALAAVTGLYWRADAQRAAAEASAGRSATDAAHAAAQTELARTTVDDLVSSLGNKLATTQDIPGVRREMYGKALALYRRFAAESGGDAPAVRRGLARTLARLASAERDAGRFVEARAAYAESEALLRGLAAEQPDDPAYAKDLSYTLSMLGGLRRATGDGPGAAAAYREAADLDARGGPNRSVMNLNNLAVVLREAGRPAEAAAVFREALAVLRAQAAAGGPEGRYHVAVCLSNLAGLEGESGQAAAAGESFREAVTLLEELSASVPQNPKYREALGDALNNRAALLAGVAGPEAAVEGFRQALAVRARLADDAPDVPRHRHRLAQTHSNLGAVLDRAGRRDEALAESERAVSELERLTAAHPAAVEYRADLAAACGNRGDWLSRAGRPAEALPWFDRAVALVESGPAVLLQGAEGRRNHVLRLCERAEALAALARPADAARDWDRALSLADPAGRAEVRSRRAAASTGGHSPERR